MLWFPKRRRKDRPHLAVVRLRHLWPDGSLMWENEVENRLFNDGCEIVLDYVYANVSAPFTSNWYGRLFGGAPADTDVISTLAGEPVGNGYAAVAWARGTTDFGLSALVGGQMQTAGATKTFGPATGSAWPAVTTLVFATTNDSSARLLARFTLSTPRTLAVGQTLGVTPTGILRGVSV